MEVNWEYSKNIKYKKVTKQKNFFPRSSRGLLIFAELIYAQLAVSEAPSLALSKSML